MCMYDHAPQTPEERRAMKRELKAARERNRIEKQRAKAARECAQWEALPLYDDFKTWAAGLFDVIAYMACIEEGSKKRYTAFCECGKTFEPPVRKSGTYVICPHCGRRVRLRDVRRSGWWGDHKTVALLQKCSLGYMQRIFIVYKRTRFYEDCTATVEIDFEEEQRDVVGADGFKEGRFLSYHQKRGTDQYVAGAGYMHGSGWCAWRAEDGPMETFPGNLDEVLAGGKFQYSQLEIAAAHQKVNPFDYLRRYVNYPEVERLYKAGLYKFAWEYLTKQVERGRNTWAYLTSPKDYGLVTQEDFAEAAGNNYGIAELMARKRIRGWEFSDADEKAAAVAFMMELNYQQGTEFEYSFITNRSLFGYYWREQREKYLAEIQNRSMVRREDFVRQNFIVDYNDYVTSCIELRYDLTDTAISRPHNFQEMHDRVTSLLRDLRAKREAEKWKGVQVVYEQLHDLIEWTDGKLLVRMAHDAADLIREGREMHHCVGTYGRRVAEGQCFILFIRRAAEPDKAFYTVEIKPDLTGLKIVQVRGYRNSDRSAEERAEVEAFLARYERWFNARPLGDHVLQAQPIAAAV